MTGETPLKDTSMICNFNSYLCQDLHREILATSAGSWLRRETWYAHPTLTGSAAAEPATGMPMSRTS